MAVQFISQYLLRRNPELMLCDVFLSLGPSFNQCISRMWIFLQKDTVVKSSPELREK